MDWEQYSCALCRNERFTERPVYRGDRVFLLDVRCARCNPHGFNERYFSRDEERINALGVYPLLREERITRAVEILTYQLMPFQQTDNPNLEYLHGLSEKDSDEAYMRWLEHAPRGLEP
jgi:hypothetical protein